MKRELFGPQYSRHAVRRFGLLMDGHEVRVRVAYLAKEDGKIIHWRDGKSHKTREGREMRHLTNFAPVSIQISAEVLKFIGTPGTMR